MTMPPGGHPEPIATPRPRPEPSRPALSVVIPAYNEAQRIGPTLQQIGAYVRQRGLACEIIVVNDGSDDGTAAAVAAACGAEKYEEAKVGTGTGMSSDAPPSHLSTFPASHTPIVRVLENAQNSGKGAAVRRGMCAAAGERVLLCDADLSTPIEQLPRLEPWLDRGYDVVIGSRDLPDSELDPPQPLLRRLMAWAFRAVRRRVLLPQVRDTQCGFKLFRGTVVGAIFERQQEPGWLFDCEVLALAERLGCRIKEVGVVWHHHPSSRLRPSREAVRAMPTLLAIVRRLRRMHPGA
jgi:dolichyl-phosphate beta-glucosyltransferase